MLSHSLSLLSSRSYGWCSTNPTLNLDFVNNTTLDPAVTFTRSLNTATFFNSAGVLTTANANVPRFDYNPTTLAARGLLIEEQRTNSIRNNTMQGAVAGTPGTVPTNWSVSGLGTLTQTVVGTGTSNGINYIDIRLNGTTSTTQVSIRTETSNGAAAANGQTWAHSVWCAVVGGSLSNVTGSGISCNLWSSVPAYLTTVFGGSLNTSATLTRTSASGTIANASTAFIQQQITLDFSSGVAIDITLRIGLPQLEQGAFATSVIPTSGTALTRNADVASVTGANFSSWYNAVEGTFFAEFLTGVSVATQQAVLNASNSALPSNNRISIRFGNEFVTSGGVTSANFFITPTASAISKWAFASKLDDFAFARNGGAPSTDTSGAMPVGVDQMQLGNSDAVGTTYLNGHLRRITYYPRRLSNAELQAITV